jgi:very-long-chain (3R)-3-hydroxyacyl-CoA dehydratase
MGAIILRGYLFLVNGITAILWLRVLLSIMQVYVYMLGLSSRYTYSQGYTPHDGFALAWPTIRSSMLLAQTVSSIHECAHSVTGIVRSDITTTILQNFARLLVAWLVVDCNAHTRTAAEVIMCTAWATSEVGRYLYLTVSTLKPESTPFVLLWLRYSLFLVCYPAGILAEFWLYSSVLPTLVAGEGCPAVLKDLDLFLLADGGCAATAGPFLGGVIGLSTLAYLPGVPMLFGRMMRQRRKKLGKGEKSS